MIIHVKTPKTGTTSIDAYARDHISDKRVFEIDQTTAAIFDKMSDREIGELQYITGHLVTSERISRIKRIFPESFVFTVFREPVSWLISHYNYRFRFKKLGAPRWMYVQDPRRSQIAWYLVRVKGSIGKVFLSKFWHPSKLYAVLYDDVNLVIPTDKINEVVPHLFQFLGVTEKPKPLPHRNSAGKEIHRKWTLSKNMEERLLKHYKRDVDFYSFMKRRFDVTWLELIRAKSSLSH